MRVIKKTGNSDIATVYVAENGTGRLVEFVESVQPPIPLSEKWVIVISTLFGCPVDCKFCDAGGDYRGRLSLEELLFQVDYLVARRFGSNGINTSRFKIQFSRMGEPSFNPAVLEALRILPERYVVRELVPSLSTIGPAGRKDFFSGLIRIKNDLYPETFQLQFSLHSTDSRQRDEFIPGRKMDFRQLASYGNEFYGGRGKKVTLNFALTDRTILDANELLKYFDPSVFLVKVTPMNPTFKAYRHELRSSITPAANHHPAINHLEVAGYQVIKSIGEWEENRIGSNCGQYVNALTKSCEALDSSYTAALENL